MTLGLQTGPQPEDPGIELPPWPPPNEEAKNDMMIATMLPPLDPPPLPVPGQPHRGFVSHMFCSNRFGYWYVT